MKLSLLYKKPAAYHLFYANDEWTSRLLVLMKRKSLTIEQVRQFKALGFEIEMQMEEPKEPEELVI